MDINWYSFIPGYFQGLTKVFTTYPFDVIKIKMQTNTYNHPITCFKDLIKNDPKIFLRGIKLPLLVFPIDRAISYKIYEDCNNHNINPYYSAFIGGITSSVISVPMQYFTTNAIHMNKDNYKGIFNLITNNIKNNNNFFKGYYIDTTRAILGSTIFLGTYGNIRQQLPNEEIYTIISSISSITVTWSITFPLDTIRVDKQITQNTSIKDLIIKRYNKFGIINFYNGLSPILIRSIPSTILGMLVYENIKKKIE